MAKAKKATDPSAPKTTRSRKPVAETQDNVSSATVSSSTSTNLDRASAEEHIRRRAYELFLARQGNGGGSPEEDWARAEYEILGKSA